MELILVAGPSGSGKTTSIANLDYKETAIVNCLGKSLPFQGWKKKYNKKNKNLFNTDDYNLIPRIIKNVDDNRPDIKTLVIDDSTYVMTSEFMSRASETGLTY